MTTTGTSIPSKNCGCYRISAGNDKARPPVALVGSSPLPVPRTHTSVNPKHSHAHPQSPTSPCSSSVPLEFHRATFNPLQPSRVVQAPSPDPNRSKPPQYKHSPPQWPIQLTSNTSGICVTGKPWSARWLRTVTNPSFHTECSCAL